MIKLSQILLEETSKPKAIIMAGGAGAGKTFLLDKLNLDSLPIYNPDKYVEDENHPYFNNLSAASGQVTKDVEAASEKGESFVWDTTASNPQKVQDLLAKGYDVFMVMVYTHPMISFISNFSRERRIPKVAVFSTWDDVYSLIDDYKKVLGDNFALYINLRDGKYSKEIADFNNAAEQGAKGIEDYLNQYMEANGGREAFKSSFRKEFELSSELESKFQEILKGANVDKEDEDALKALRKDFDKYVHHYESGKYGKDRLENLFQKQLLTREKAATREAGVMSKIAERLHNPTFQDLLAHSTPEEIDRKIQNFL